MTRYSDNIYSGHVAPTSAACSRSYVTLGRTFNFSAAVGSVTQSGTFPPGTQNVTAELFITQNGSATTSNKLTVSAGGTNLLTIDQFGSAGGYANQTTTSIARFSIIASAAAAPPVPSPSVNGGDIPYSVTFLKVSADKTGTYQLSLKYNRVDTGFAAPGSLSGGNP